MDVLRVDAHGLEGRLAAGLVVCGGRFPFGPVGRIFLPVLFSQPGEPYVIGKIVARADESQFGPVGTPERLAIGARVHAHVHGLAVVRGLYVDLAVEVEVGHAVGQPFPVRAPGDVADRAPAVADQGSFVGKFAAGTDIGHHQVALASREGDAPAIGRYGHAHFILFRVGDADGLVLECLEHVPLGSVCSAVQVDVEIAVVTVAGVEQRGIVQPLGVQVTVGVFRCVDGPALLLVGLLHEDLPADHEGHEFPVGRHGVLRHTVGEGLEFVGIEPVIGGDGDVYLLRVAFSGPEQVEVGLLLEYDGASVSGYREMADGLVLEFGELFRPAGLFAVFVYA